MNRSQNLARTRKGGIALGYNVLALDFPQERDGVLQCA